MATWGRPLAGLLLLYGSLTAATTVDAGHAAPQEALPTRLEHIEQDLRRLRVGSGASPLTEVWSQGCPLPPAEADALARSLRERAEAARRNPAVDLEAGVGEDLAGNASDSELFLGVSWNLLESGRRSLRRRARVLELDAQLAETAGTMARREHLAACRSDALRRHFGRLADVLAERRIELLEALKTATRRAYLDGEVLMDRLLEVEAELAAARAHRDMLPAAGPVPARLPALPVPDFAALEEAIRRDATRERLLWLEQNRLREEHQGRSSGDQLRLFARYQVDGEESADSGFAFGVRYRRPLFQRRAAGLGARLEASRLAHEQDLRRQLDRLGRDRMTIGRTLRETEQANYDHLQSLERLRRANAEWRLEPSPVALARAARDGAEALRAAVRLVAGLEAAHLAVAEVLAGSGVERPERFLRLRSLPGADYRARSADRALYVWSSTLDRLGAGPLGDLAAARGFARLIVSTGSHSPHPALAQLEAQWRPAVARVERLVGANRWALPENHEAALERVRAMALPGGGLHLDVEPHALDAYRDRPDRLLESYLTLLERVRDALPGDTVLSVSVPLIWPKEIYRRLAAHVDRVYLMAYGSDRPDTLARRLAPVLEQLEGTERVLALRPADFARLSELDLTYARLAAQLHLDGLAVHDAAALLGLEPEPQR